MSLDVNPFVEIHVNDGWVDITADVHTADGSDGIEIEHGNQGMNAGLGEPSSASMTFMGWDLWPHNAAGPWFESLDIGTPLRCGVGLFDNTFPGTVVDGWSDVDGMPVTNSGAGGVVADSDFQQTPGVGTHSVPGTSQHRKSLIEDANQGDGEQSIEFRLPTSNVTGGAFEPGNLISRWFGDYYIMLRLVVNTDETITLQYKQIDDIGLTEFDLTDVFPTTVTNTGQWIAVKVNVEENRMQAKVWAAGEVEPLAWDLDAEHVFALANVWGGVGVRTGVASGNTNAAPRVVEYRNWVHRSVQFYGGISDFSPEPIETDDGDVFIPITANGPSRRFSQGQLPVVSALARAIPSQPGLVAYWPFEDGDNATEFASGLPGQPAMTVRRGIPDFAAFSELAATQPLVVANQADWIGDVLPYTHTGEIQMRFILDVPSAQADATILIRLYTDHPTATLWQLVYRTASGGSLEVQAWISETESVYVTSTGESGIDGTVRRFSFELEQSGADVLVRTSQFPFDGTGGSFTDHTATGRTLASVKRVWVNPNLLDTVAFGHLQLQSERTDLFDLYFESTAYDGESLLTRMGRSLTENRVAFTTHAAIDFDMGPQQAENLTTILEQAIELDSGGFFYDGKTHDGCMYYPRDDLSSQYVQVELTYSQLFGQFRPRRDDRDVRNKVTVKRDGGSSGTYELETGRRSTLPPDQGGIGIYESEINVNKFDDSALQQIAAARVAVGTVDEPRYTEATIELSSPELTATPSVRRRLLDLHPGQLATITGAEKVRAYDTIRQIVPGFTQTITQFRHSFTLNTLPGSPFDTFILEHPDFGRLDSASSTLEYAVDASQTTFTVQVGSQTLWTEDPAQFPFDIVIGGERMTVTGIATDTPAFVAAGTAAHADNTTVVPGLPGGTTTTGDLLLIQAAARDLTAFPTCSNPDYALLLNVVNHYVWGKIHDGSEAAPTIGISGGAAGSTLSAQMCSFRNVPAVNRASAVVGGGPLQNIGHPSIYSPMSKSVALYAGWKQDDWTSVAPVTGGTEIQEASTTTGSDQGIVWDYQAFTGEVSVPDGSFAVTGGATAVYRSGVMVLGNWQKFTVTRGVNMPAKSHGAGAEVHIYRPSRWALL